MNYYSATAFIVLDKSLKHAQVITVLWVWGLDNLGGYHINDHNNHHHYCWQTSHFMMHFCTFHVNKPLDRLADHLKMTCHHFLIPNIFFAHRSNSFSYFPSASPSLLVLFFQLVSPLMLFYLFIPPFISNTLSPNHHSFPSAMSKQSQMSIQFIQIKNRLPTSYQKILTKKHFLLECKWTLNVFYWTISED